MPELPPYNLSYPADTDDPADFPLMLQSDLSALMDMSVGQFDTTASAQAALGSSSQTPRLFITQNPSTLWCLDSAGRHQVWSLGSGYTAGDFVITDTDGNSFSLGSSTRSIRYRVEGAHVYGWATMTVGSNVSWPSGKYLWFPLPYAATSAAGIGVQIAVGSVYAKVNSKLLVGTAYASGNAAHVSLVTNDTAKGNDAYVMSYSTGNSGSGLTFAAGDIIGYSFDYERNV